MENENYYRAILEILKLILEEMRKPRSASKKQNELLDGLEVKSILKISDSTLYRLKKSKAIYSVVIGKREYYRLPDIEGLINFYKK